MRTREAARWILFAVVLAGMPACAKPPQSMAPLPAAESSGEETAAIYPPYVIGFREGPNTRRPGPFTRSVALVAHPPLASGQHWYCTHDIAKPRWSKCDRVIAVCEQQRSRLINAGHSLTPCTPADTIWCSGSADTTSGAWSEVTCHETAESCRALAELTSRGGLYTSGCLSVL